MPSGNLQWLCKPREQSISLWSLVFHGVLNPLIPASWWWGCPIKYWWSFWLNRAKCDHELSTFCYFVRNCQSCTLTWSSKDLLIKNLDNAKRTSCSQQNAKRASLGIRGHWALVLLQNNCPKWIPGRLTYWMTEQKKQFVRGRILGLYTWKV